MGNGRPRFDQPPLRRCMWVKCPNLNMVSPDVDMCLRHAIIISGQLDKNAKYQQQLRQERIEQARAKAQWDRQEKLQLEIQMERVKAGKPQRTDLFHKVENKWVYYVRVEDQIKIGFTSDLDSRLKSYPPNAQVLGIEYGGKDLERQRHEQFHAYLAYGREWFQDTQEIHDHIATLPRWQHLVPKRMRRGPANQASRVQTRYWSGK